MARPIPQIDLRMADLDRLVDRTRDAPLTDEEHAQLKAAIHTLGYLADLLEQKGTTMAGLRQLLFGAQTEKTQNVLARAGVTDPATPSRPASRPAATHRRRTGGAVAMGDTRPRRTREPDTSPCRMGSCSLGLGTPCV